MDYLLYTVVLVLSCLFLYGMLVGAEEHVAQEQPAPKAVPHEESPELAPDIYARALAYLLVEAELRGLELVQRGDDEAGKGARV